MILSQLHDITIIDSEIVELHEKLQALYAQRAEITTVKNKPSSTSATQLDDTIDLESIDLSL